MKIKYLVRFKTENHKPKWYNTLNPVKAERWFVTTYGVYTWFAVYNKKTAVLLSENQFNNRPMNNVRYLSN